MPVEIVRDTTTVHVVSTSGQVVVQTTTTPITVVDRIGYVVPVMSGSPGPPGPGAVQNLFIQQTAPSAVEPYLWWELNPDNTPKTLWVAS